MAREQYKNNPVSTLNGAINNSTTTVVLTSAVSFPTTGNFRIIVDLEIMKVTAVASDTLTVVRGQEGTTALSHSDLTDVFGIITSASWDAMREDNEFYGTYSSRPTAELSGRVARYSDALVIERDNGSTWDTFGPIYKFVSPDLADFTWVNQDSATVAQQGTAIYLAGPISGSDSLRCQMKSVPGATPYSVILAFSSNFQAINTNHFGFALRESGSGKFVTFTIQYNSAWILAIYKWNSISSFNAAYVQITPQTRDLWWMKFEDNGTDRKFYWSGDGVNWILLSSHGNTDFITADEWGFYVDPTGIAYDVGMTLHSWAES